MQQSRKKSYSMCLLHKISKKKFLILMGFSQLEFEIEQCSISLNELQNKLYSFRYLIATFSISNVLFHLVFTSGGIFLLGIAFFSKISSHFPSLLVLDSAYATSWIEASRFLKTGELSSLFLRFLDRRHTFFMGLST